MQQESVCVFCVVRSERGYKKDKEERLSFETPVCQDRGGIEIEWNPGVGSRGKELRDNSGRWLRKSGKKLIRPCKEEFICAASVETRCKDTTSED
jgi:hypothetical protein